MHLQDTEVFERGMKEDINQQRAIITEDTTSQTLFP